MASELRVRIQKLYPDEGWVSRDPKDIILGPYDKTGTLLGVINNLFNCRVQIMDYYNRSGLSGICTVYLGDSYDKATATWTGKTLVSLSKPLDQQYDYVKLGTVPGIELTTRACIMLLTYSEAFKNTPSWQFFGNATDYLA